MKKTGYRHQFGIQMKTYSAQEGRDLDLLEWYDPFLDVEQALIIEAYVLIARGVARDLHF